MGYCTTVVVESAVKDRSLASVGHTAATQHYRSRCKPAGWQLAARSDETQLSSQVWLACFELVGQTVQVRSAVDVLVSSQQSGLRFVRLNEANEDLAQDSTDLAGERTSVLCSVVCGDCSHDGLLAKCVMLHCSVMIQDPLCQFRFQISVIVFVNINFVFVRLVNGVDFFPVPAV